MKKLIPKAILFLAPMIGWSATYSVEIRNATRGQSLSPFVLAAHSKEFKLYSLGKPSSEGVWRLAEDGHTSFLKNELEQNTSVKQIIVADAGIKPGASQSHALTTDDNGNVYLSLIS